MKYFYIACFSIFLFSCRKCKHDPSILSLNETQWDLYFKNNSSFTFYAHSDLYFRGDDSIFNYRNFDTLTGTWNESGNAVSIDFNNGDRYSGTIYTTDSISGTLTASGNNGVWYAKKK